MINEKLKELRKNKNLTQAQLAKILNISRQAYSHYETGDNDLNTDIILKLCVFYNISADELLEIETAEERKRVIINN